MFVFQATGGKQKDIALTYNIVPGIMTDQPKEVFQIIIPAKSEIAKDLANVNPADYYGTNTEVINKKPAEQAVKNYVSKIEAYREKNILGEGGKTNDKFLETAKSDFVKEYSKHVRGNYSAENVANKLANSAETESSLISSATARAGLPTRTLVPEPAAKEVAGGWKRGVQSSISVPEGMKIVPQPVKQAQPKQEVTAPKVLNKVGGN